MALHKISDFDADYRDSFQGNDIKGMSVYAQGTDEKIGSVNDVLVDDEGHLRYFIVDLGFWIFGKKVLLPVGRSRIDYGTDRVYAIGMTREQAESLPEFSDRLALDYDYEENVRGVYRNSTTSGTASLEASAPLESSAALDADAAAYQQPATTSASLASTPIYNRDTYSYREEPSLYEMNEQDHQTLKLYEERLIANKQRRKTGEVTVGKHVETETARVAVPVEKERVVIERVTPENAGQTVDASQATFREGEVARMEIYEETADVRKEAFVREEVKVTKVVDQETVEAKETIRREELDVNAPGLPIDER
ncbi:MAG: DUF2382 domain-containing protein [Cyanomargarita calcarea GSE-NOS-MK-12-04C]|jgi:uncharacterized protein (TIGR02271 family)|uniref:DUF2382 domain-containing protein n=1 Tax=Cyanomargarita calcarea GSE-NOS-MK-12-04C TaxID=2839659 RepID=A0A951QRF2_9CYAN|nr:DUF2382 domain-containing protein [Cyanomargarita calcarea GSE-NOS-MK-12-04C]